jgi:hypothetical protein
VPAEEGASARFELTVGVPYPRLYSEVPQLRRSQPEWRLGRSKLRLVAGCYVSQQLVRSQLPNQLSRLSSRRQQVVSREEERLGLR